MEFPETSPAREYGGPELRREEGGLAPERDDNPSPGVLPPQTEDENTGFRPDLNNPNTTDNPENVERYRNNEIRDPVTPNPRLSDPDLPQPSTDHEREASAEERTADWQTGRG